MSYSNQEYDPSKIRIYVGTDRSQRLGTKVLEHSVRKHCSMPVKLYPLLQDFPEPKDKRNVQRTGFSFSRFAVPELAGYRGKAIYMDADMLVFKDIAELWSIPFDGATILIQGEFPEHLRNKRNIFGQRRVIQNSVSLMDCAALAWDVEKIISGLDGSYNYKALLYDLCIVDRANIGYKIPFEWNSLEYWDEDTCNLHYTDMSLQPWVSPNNRFGYLWLNELKEMIDSAQIDWKELEEEVSLGFARPSLLTEMKLDEDLSLKNRKRVAMLEKIDRTSGFVKHREVKIAQQNRRKAERRYILNKAVQGIKNMVIKTS